MTKLSNLTITLDPQVLAWARIEAAKRDMSLSRYVGEVLREKFRHSHEYQAAYRAFLAETPLDLKGASERYPTREELYDRPVLRRR